MSFAQWLRSTQIYLLWAAQDRIAKQKGIKASSKSRGLKDRFWRYVFAPTYFVLPDGLRQFAMHSLPLEATVAPGQGPIRGDVSKVLRFPIIFFPDGSFPSYSPSKRRVNA